MANPEMQRDHSRLDKSLYASKKGKSDSSYGRVSDKSQSRKSGIKRASSFSSNRTPLKSESDKQKDLNKRWSFIRACFLLCQKRTDGYYSCMSCGRTYTNAKALQLNHITRRARGGEYTPQNAELLGTGPGTCQCHERADGNLVEWTGRETA